jgi:hypothetical protein
MTHLKVSSIRFDGAQEFGKSLSFKSFCHQEKIVMEPVVHHNLATDLHVFGSYVTVHLPHVHPLVADTTHDDRVLEGIWIDNDLHTPNVLSVDLQT